ncbi:unnamed protein product [Prorocentrum cordatum]|uniref:Uncharacterized protein n=1 Tax=Prorocentrum cordatum TaxID=2364126 RepID=A0ABN9V842_9DINO|nr:unnamed protein product [Polarella glacialis]
MNSWCSARIVCAGPPLPGERGSAPEAPPGRRFTQIQEVRAGRQQLLFMRLFLLPPLSFDRAIESASGKSIGLRPLPLLLRESEARARHSEGGAAGRPDWSAPAAAVALHSRPSGEASLSRRASGSPARGGVPSPPRGGARTGATPPAPPQTRGRPCGRTAVGDLLTRVNADPGQQETKNCNAGKTTAAPRCRAQEALWDAGVVGALAPRIHLELLASVGNAGVAGDAGVAGGAGFGHAAMIRRRAETPDWTLLQLCFSSARCPP